MKLITVGYRRRSVAQVVDLVRVALGDEKHRGPVVFVDVRRSTASRDTRWRGEAVEEALKEFGCEYLPPRFVMLGNGGKTAAFEPLHPKQAERTIELLAQKTRAGKATFVLFCLEQDAAQCHRAAIAEQVAAQVPGLEVVHVLAARDGGRAA